MELYRKLLILFVIFCFTYIIFLLIQKRLQLFYEKIQIEQQQQQRQSEGFTEGATDSTDSTPSTSIVSNIRSAVSSVASAVSVFPSAESELAKMKSAIPPKIVNFKLNVSNLPICQYIIKSSYCTPFTGSFVSLDAITYVLSRGCRFIDIELYMVNNAVVVGQSTDPTNMTIGSNNTLSIDDVLNWIALNAFTSPSPNPRDPMFLQLRIKSTDPNMNQYTAMSIDKNLSKLLYTSRNGNKQVGPTTKIGDLMGSIVLIIDKTVCPGWSTLPDCSIVNAAGKCYNLRNYANMIAGQPQLKTSTYINILDQSKTPYLVIDDTLAPEEQRVNIQNMKMVTPPIVSSRVNNPDSSQLISDYGTNIICFQYFFKDYNLTNYEQLFSDNNSAFVSFAQYTVPK
jgi:hypothetical protein